MFKIMSVEFCLKHLILVATKISMLQQTVQLVTKENIVVKKVEKDHTRECHNTVLYVITKLKS